MAIVLSQQVLPVLGATRTAVAVPLPGVSSAHSLFILRTGGGHCETGPVTPVAQIQGGFLGCDNHAHRVLLEKLWSSTTADTSGRWGVL